MLPCQRQREFFVSKNLLSDRKKDCMNEAEMSRNLTSVHGNSFDARGMYRQFNGELMPLQILGTGNPRAIIDAIANAQWKEMAEGILPPEIFKMLEPYIHGFTAQMEKFLDAASERQHAVENRSNFGEPQSVLALPVFHSLTKMTDESHEAAVAHANQAEQVLQWLRNAMRETFLVWHLAEVAKHEAKLKELENATQAIVEQNAQTTFARAEATTFTNFLTQKKEKIQQGLALAEAKLLAFTMKVFGSDLSAAENVIFNGRGSTNMLALDPSRAIPVTADDLAKAN